MDVRYVGVSEVNLKEKVISLYFKVNGLDQIIKELFNEGIEINHDSICSIMRGYISSLRSIKSFHDIDSEKMPDRQREFIKTIIDDEKARRLYKEYLEKAAALKKEHIRSMNEITKPFNFKQSVVELDAINSGMIKACLMDLLINGTTPESLGEFVKDLEEIAISKHIKFKTAFDNVIRHSKKDLETMRTRLYESRAKKWLKDRRESDIEFR